MTRTEDSNPTIGLLLAAAVITAWLAIHFGGIFLWQWRPGSIPLATALIGSDIGEEVEPPGRGGPITIIAIAVRAD